MDIQQKNINSIMPYDKNPRKNDAAVEYVANSINEFGFKVPLVIDKNGVIVAGHTRYKAALQLGIDQVPCIVADDLTPEQIKAYRLADNKVAEFSEWDFNILDAELAECLEIDMGEFGFEFDDIDIDALGDDFTLKDGERSDMCIMNFTLHRKQQEVIQAAIKRVLNDGLGETFGNTNKNGNALYAVVSQWADAGK